jgi:pimeloyl-ACP methyl ester carboxylesterase
LPDLARPCQYITSSGCTKSYWTSHRFDPKVIQSYQDALNQLKQMYRNDSFTLIGYSGGAAVAILTAASRDDVKKIITIAGNVDTAKWVEIHHLDPLNGSLNPTDNVQRVENIDQIHLIGMNDTVVPKEVFLSYLSHFNDHSHVKYKLMDASHSENWEFIYKEFLHNHP